MAPCVRFEPEKILKTLSAERCTAVYGSPSMMIALLEHPSFSREQWAFVTKGIIGGAPCPMELMRRLVKDVGVSDITVAYGITETASWITMTRPQDPIERRVATIGTPLECCEVRIVDPKTGQPVGPGNQGELCTRGYLMRGYYNMPAATAAAIDPEGWFHTGDLGEMDEQGYVKITGRLKDVITRDEVEIYPVEIEEILYEIPEVSEAQVFGFTATGSGQEVAAWIRHQRRRRAFPGCGGRTCPKAGGPQSPSPFLQVRHHLSHDRKRENPKIQTGAARPAGIRRPRAGIGPKTGRGKIP